MDAGREMQAGLSDPPSAGCGGRPFQGAWLSLLDCCYRQQAGRDSAGPPGPSLWVWGTLLAGGHGVGQSCVLRRSLALARLYARRVPRRAGRHTARYTALGSKPVEAARGAEACAGRALGGVAEGAGLAGTVPGGGCRRASWEPSTCHPASITRVGVG